MQASLYDVDSQPPGTGRDHSIKEVYTVSCFIPKFVTKAQS